MNLRVLAAGGTFDKSYDPISGQLGFGESNIPQMLARARVTIPIAFELLPLLDSLDMQDADRKRILDACDNSPEERIVVVHGTDTMRETAEVVGNAALSKVVVLTGAMIPYTIAESDAFFNLGFACAAAQTLPHGVYIAMNGLLFTWDRVRKNRAEGVFEAY